MTRPRAVRPTRHVDLYFSDYFDVRRRTIERYGALDVSLVADLPLFIDPFLLFNSRRPVYRNLHNRIVEYLRFLRGKAETGSLTATLIRSWYAFREVRQTWLGFTRSGNRGAGLGKDFASALHENLGRLFHDFGDERITKGSHLEKLCLIKDGVGRDKISDFTTRLILDHLCDFTERFTKQHVPRKHRKRVAVDRAVFSYRVQRWVSKVYTLPWFDADYVLLTPVDLLTKDENWINRSDLVDDFEEVLHQLPTATPDSALRAEINNYFLTVLPPRSRGKDLSKKEKADAIQRTLGRYPQLIDYYIRFKEEHGDEAVRRSRQKVEYSERVFLRQAGELAGLLASETDFYRFKGDAYSEALARLKFLKHVVEERGGYRLFYDGQAPIERESDVHVLYDLVWYGSPADVNREVNTGRGPADFAISQGAKDKVVIELKLASNPRLRRNLEKQAEIYKKSARAQRTLKAVVFFTEEEERRVRKTLRELSISGTENIVLIDARADNKPSGSKA